MVGIASVVRCVAAAAPTGLLLYGISFSTPATAETNPIDGRTFSALREFVQSIDGERPQVASFKQAENPHHSFSDKVFSELREFAEQLAGDQPSSDGAPRIKIAEADNALDALRDFLRSINPPEGTPDRPNQSTPTAPRQLPPATPRPATPRPAPRFVNATPVGTKTCLLCHASQAESFSKTLMGRIGRTHQPGKFDCENCHGPGSAHVQAVGCAACHGDGGISTRPGMPSLVGQTPQYLVPAMKTYVTGQRKHELMRALLAGVSEAELHNIANYYARQPSARAQTPLIGDASAGKKASMLRAGCHGEHGIAEFPAWPNHAGQDAQYLAEAIHAYKRGTRSKAIACAACHGEGGISKKSGMPSLVGMDAQYLVAAMKAYTSGQRKHDLMAVLLAGVGEAELNNIANYYARQTPARARTSTVGDAAAGKAASAACSGCHGGQGVSTNPAWPSLAGQDAQYLADAMRAYNDGSRNDATMKSLLASVDARTINNMAAYYASLAPGKPNPSSGAPAGRDPIVVRNNVVASLNGRAVNDVASYYASLRPAQVHSAKHAPGRPDPELVTKAAPAGGFSVGGIISFRINDPGRSAEENNAICLSCHAKGQRTNWHGSTHDQQGLQCSNCHTVMKNVSRKAQLKTEFQPDTCFQCHKNKRAEMWRTSHMPVREGKVTCANCHNPHGSYSEALLKTATVNETCYQCHAEKRGPFLWEHPPVTESCLNCHDPHGSINDFMLKISRPRLCQQCHSGGQHNSNPRNPSVTLYAQGRECQNCHSNHHGSNNPAGPRFMR